MKRTASTLAAALVAGAVAIVPVTSASAFDALVPAGCWADGISTTISPWLTQQRVSINGLSYPSTVPPGQPVTVDYAFDAGPLNEGPDLGSSTITTFAQIGLYSGGSRVATVTTSAGPAAGVDNGQPLPGASFPSVTLQPPGSGPYTVAIDWVSFSLTYGAGVQVLCGGNTGAVPPLPVGNPLALLPNPVASATGANVRQRTLDFVSHPSAPFAQTSIMVGGTAAASVAGVTGQLGGVAAGREGATVSLTGTGWNHGVASAELCSYGGPCVPMSSVTLTADAGGGLSGTAVIAPGSPIGDGQIRVSQVSGELAVVPFRVLGQPAITVSPASGPVGSTVTVDGADWNPGGTVSIRSASTLPPGPIGFTSDPVQAVTVGPGGQFTTAYTVGASDAVGFAAVQFLAPGLLTAATGFSLAQQTSFSISDVNGMPFPSPVREGDVLGLSGASWPADLGSGDLSAELCPSIGGCQALSQDLSTDTTGQLAGSVTLGAGLPLGPALLRLSTLGTEYAVAVTVLGPLDLTVTPTTAVGGTSVAVDGTGFPLNAPVTLAGYDQIGTQTGETRTIHTDARGEFRTTFPLTSSTITLIRASGLAGFAVEASAPVSIVAGGSGPTIGQASGTVFTTCEVQGIGARQSGSITYQLEVSPASAMPGDLVTVTVSGSGWSPTAPPIDFPSGSIRPVARVFVGGPPFIVNAVGAPPGEVGANSPFFPAGWSATGTFTKVLPSPQTIALQEFYVDYTDSPPAPATPDLSTTGDYRCNASSDPVTSPVALHTANAALALTLGAPSVTVAVSEVEGQLPGVTADARPGAWVTLDGTGWDASLATGDTTARVCTIDQETCSAPLEDSLVTDGSGRLGGQVRLPESDESGSRRLWVSGGTATALTTVYLLPDPAIAAPPVVDLGDELGVTLTGLDPTRTYAVRALDAAGVMTTDGEVGVVAALGSHGDATGQITLRSGATVFLALISDGIELARVPVTTRASFEVITVDGGPWEAYARPGSRLALSGRGWPSGLPVEAWSAQLCAWYTGCQMLPLEDLAVDAGDLSAAVTLPTDLAVGSASIQLWVGESFATPVTFTVLPPLSLNAPNSLQAGVPAPVMVSGLILGREYEVRAVRADGEDASPSSSVTVVGNVNGDGYADIVVNDPLAVSLVLAESVGGPAIASTPIVVEVPPASLFVSAVNGSQYVIRNLRPDSVVTFQGAFWAPDLGPGSFTVEFCPEGLPCVPASSTFVTDGSGLLSGDVIVPDLPIGAVEIRVVAGADEVTLVDVVKPRVAITVAPESAPRTAPRSFTASGLDVGAAAEFVMLDGSGQQVRNLGVAFAGTDGVATLSILPFPPLFGTSVGVIEAPGAAPIGIRAVAFTPVLQVRGVDGRPYDGYVLQSGARVDVGGFDWPADLTGAELSASVCDALESSCTSVPSDLVTDGSGALNGIIDATETPLPQGSMWIRVTDGSATAKVSVTVLGDIELQLDNDVVTLGDSATLSVSGFLPGRSLTVTALDSAGDPVADLAAVVMDPTGAGSELLYFGDTRVRALGVRDASGTQLATIGVTVNPTLTSLRFQAANRTWDGYARAGDELELNGNGWLTQQAAVVELCSLDQSACVSVGTGSGTDTGYLQVTLSVPEGQVGERLVRITSGGLRAVTPVTVEPVVQVLVPPAITLGTPFAVQLSGLHPGADVRLQAASAVGDVGSEFAGTAEPDGTLSMSVTISSSTVQWLRVSEDGYGFVATAALATSSALELTGVVGRTTYTSSARAGDQLVVAGSGWQALLGSGDLEAESCTVDLSSCAPSTSALSTGASGELSGTVTLPNGTPTGPRVVRVTGGGVTAVETLTIVGEPTLVVGTRDLASGASWLVTGSGWLPGQRVVLRGYQSDGVTPTADPPTEAWASAAGLVSTSVRLYAGSSTFIGGSQDGLPVEATTPVQVLAYAQIDGFEPAFPWSGSGRPGDVLKLSGRAFTPGDDGVQVELCTSGTQTCVAAPIVDTLTVDAEGDLAGTVTLPTAPTGPYSLRVTQDVNVVAITGVQMLGPLPAKSISGPSSVVLGSTFTVSGSGWPRGVQVEVTGYTSATPSASAATGDTAVATTNATGSFTASLTLRTRGTVMIGAYVAGGPSRDAEAARAIALAPNARVVGVAGSRFLPGRLLQLSGEGWPTGPVTAAVCSPTCGPGALLSADDDGVVDGSLAIPADLGPGSYVVRLTADAVQATTSPFTIAAPTVARTGTERVEPGGSLAVSGSNWPDGAVSVQFCPTIDTCLAAASTIEVGAEGDFAPGASVTVPDAVSAGSSGLLRFTSGVFEAAEFVSLPPPPSIVVSPSSVQVGDEASVLGSGWEPGSVVTLSLARSSTDEPLAASTDVTADSNGAFQADVAVASPLTKRIIARSGSLSASGTILVVEDPVTTVPSAWITAVAGQGTGSFLARPGDQIELRGVAWTGPRTSPQITARLCSDSGSNCSTVLTSALSVDSAGVLTGAVNLPPSLGVGSWGIRVSSGAQTAVAPVGVASSSLPTLEVSESVVPWGRTVTVTGTGWSGLGPLQVRGFVTPTAFGESADAPVSFSSGSFSVTFLIRDKRTTAIGVVANGGASRTPYLARPVEVVVGAGIGQVLGQLNGVTGYARAGNGLSIEGDLWPVDLAVGTIGARFCSGPWSCIEQPTNTLATDGQARLSGTVPLPVGLPTGLSVLELTAGGGAPVQIPFTVLGPPRAATVGELDLGQPLPVTGYDFDPGTIVYIYGLEFGTAGAGFRGMVRPMPTASASLQGTSDPTVTAVVGPDGSFTVDYVVNDPDTITIGVYGGVAGAPPVVGSPPTTTYDVVEAQLDQCVVPDPDPTGEGCSTEQRVSATVIPGSLIQQAQPTGANASATAVDLGQMTVSSTPEVLSGELNSITVTDTRGGQSVWSLTAFLAGLSEPGGGSIAASAVVLTPSCSVNASGSAPGAVAGDPGQNLGTTATLCVKNGDVGLGGSTSGQYVIASPVDLTVPAFQKAGNYTGTIVITLT